MNPRLALARMSRSAGIGGFAQADIAHAVGYVHHPQAADLALYLWAGQDDMRIRVVEHLCDWAARHMPKASHVRALAIQALAEHASPKQCRPCGGTGHAKGNPAADVCPKCLGVGYVPMTDTARATAAGLHHSTWARQGLAGPYRELQGRIRYLEGIAMGRIRRALGDGANDAAA